MQEYLSIKSWAADDRPREKLAMKGRKALSDAELVAILIGTGTREYSAVDLAQLLLNHAGNDLNVLSSYSIHDMKKVKGIGDAKAIGLIAAMELGRRKKDLDRKKRVKITSSNMVFEEMRPYLSDLSHEEFYAISLNRANEVMKIRQISIGGFSGTIADGKVIFKFALEDGAHALILVHNHPSGQMSPSEADKILTRKMVEFGKFIDLPILDHLIFCENGYFSFADQGLIS
jgi:DNA repair protein RadC